MGNPNPGENSGEFEVPGPYAQPGQYPHSPHDPYQHQQNTYPLGPVYVLQPNRGPGYNTFQDQPANAPEG